MALKDRRTQKNKTNRVKRGGKKVGKKTKKSLRNKKRQSRRVGGAGVKRNAYGERKPAAEIGRREQRISLLRGEVKTRNDSHKHPENLINNSNGNSNYENNSASNENDNHYDGYASDYGPNLPQPKKGKYHHGTISELHLQRNNRGP
jgi:hypothetical protein